MKRHKKPRNLRPAATQMLCKKLYSPSVFSSPPVWFSSAAVFFAALSFLVFSAIFLFSSSLPFSKAAIPSLSFSYASLRKSGSFPAPKMAATINTTKNHPQKPENISFSFNLFVACDVALPSHHIGCHRFRPGR